MKILNRTTNSILLGLGGLIAATWGNGFVKRKTVDFSTASPALLRALDQVRTAAMGMNRYSPFAMVRNW